MKFSKKIAWAIAIIIALISAGYWAIQPKNFLQCMERAAERNLTKDEINLAITLCNLKFPPKSPINSKEDNYPTPLTPSAENREINKEKEYKKPETLGDLWNNRESQN